VPVAALPLFAQALPHAGNFVRGHGGVGGFGEAVGFGFGEFEDFAVAAGDSFSRSSERGSHETNQHFPAPCSGAMPGDGAEGKLERARGYRGRTATGVRIACRDRTWPCFSQGTKGVPPLTAAAPARKRLPRSRFRAPHLRRENLAHQTQFHLIPTRSKLCAVSISGDRSLGRI
jgi:hypothetical protein